MSEFRGFAQQQQNNQQYWLIGINTGGREVYMIMPGNYMVQPYNSGDVAARDLQAMGGLRAGSRLDAFVDVSIHNLPPSLCRHYCYPGPADYWALALYNLLLNNAKFATGAVRPAVLPAPDGAGQRRRRRVQ